MAKNDFSENSEYFSYKITQIDKVEAAFKEAKVASKDQKQDAIQWCLWTMFPIIIEELKKDQFDDLVDKTAKLSTWAKQSYFSPKEEKRVYLRKECLNYLKELYVHSEYTEHSPELLIETAQMIINSNPKSLTQPFQDYLKQKTPTPKLIQHKLDI